MVILAILVSILCSRRPCLPSKLVSVSHKSLSRDRHCFRVSVDRAVPLSNTSAAVITSLLFGGTRKISERLILREFPRQGGGYSAGETGREGPAFGSFLFTCVSHKNGRCSHQCRRDRKQQQNLPSTSKKQTKMTAVLEDKAIFVLFSIVPRSILNSPPKHGVLDVRSSTIIPAPGVFVFGSCFVHNQNVCVSKDGQPHCYTHL